MSPAVAPAAIPSRSQMEQWSTAHLATAATHWRSAASAAEDAFDQHRANIAAPGGTTWEGDSKDAALARADEVPIGAHRTADAPDGHPFDPPDRGGSTTSGPSEGVIDHPPQVVAGPGNETLPLVPEGATGSVVSNGKGTIYDIPRGTEGLDPRVARVRVMEPTVSGPYQYPSGYAVYENAAGQAVNPITGRTISKHDPYWHIPLQ